jgi:beta-xylosidase
MTSDAKDLEYRLHIGGVAADEEVVSRHMTWGTRIPAIEVGDTLSVRVVDVPPHATDAPDSDSDPERDAFHAAKAKYLQLKPKYEP